MNIFFDRYKRWLGDSYTGLDTVIDIPYSIRVNTLQIKDKELIRRLEKKGVVLEKIPFAKFGYRIIKTDFSLGSTNEYLQGYYYTQEAASQYPCELLDPKPGELVLDMAAAPGGKTTQLSQFMENKGCIVAIDIKTQRLEALRNNISRMGATNVLVYNKDSRYASDLKLKFDKVLLDAPCSGNFIIDKDWVNKRSFDDFKEMAKLQRELLRSGLDVLKEGGTLVYSTCSLEIEEDEENIEWVKQNFKVEVIEQRKFWPHIDKTQGFFVAKIIKK